MTKVMNSRPSGGLSSGGVGRGAATVRDVHVKRADLPATMSRTQDDSQAAQPTLGGHSSAVGISGHSTPL